MFITALGDDVTDYAVSVAEQLRNTLPGVRVMMHCGGGNLKKQLKRADKTGAKVALLLGSEEADNHQVTIKPLRDGQNQSTVSLDSLSAELESLIS